MLNVELPDAYRQWLADMPAFTHQEWAKQAATAIKIGVGASLFSVLTEEYERLLEKAGINDEAHQQHDRSWGIKASQIIEGLAFRISEEKTLPDHLVVPPRPYNNDEEMSLYFTALADYGAEAWINLLHNQYGSDAKALAHLGVVWSKTNPSLEQSLLFYQTSKDLCLKNENKKEEWKQFEQAIADEDDMLAGVMAEMLLGKQNGERLVATAPHYHAVARALANYPDHPKEVAPIVILGAEVMQEAHVEAAVRTDDRIRAEDLQYIAAEAVDLTSSHRIGTLLDVTPNTVVNLINGKARKRIPRDQVVQLREYAEDCQRRFKDICAALDMLLHN